MYEKKIGYLKGLLAGMDLDPDSRESKLFHAVLEAMEALGEAVSEVEEDIEDLDESVEELEEELEEYSEVFDVLGEAAEEGGTLRRFPGVLNEDEEDEDNEDDVEYEISCPGCEEEFVVSEETIFAGSVTCPGCKHTITFDLDSNCGCHKDHNDCGCGHCHGDEEKED